MSNLADTLLSLDYLTLQISYSTSRATSKIEDLYKANLDCRHRNFSENRLHDFFRFQSLYLVFRLKNQTV